MITYRKTPSDPITDETIDIGISDLGEGKMMDRSTPSTGGSSHGNNNFRAPEVRGYDDHTFASDVYAFGKLASEIVTLQWEIAAEHGQARKLLPAWLMELVRDCVQIDPAKRPSARTIVERLEKLEDVRDDQDNPTYHIDLVEYNADTEIGDLDARNDEDEEIPL